MTYHPVISIVMPARNEGSRVAQTIHSFINGRSYLIPLEFVIVDDASVDGCCDNLENRFGSEMNAVSVNVIRLAHWSGIPYARNKGAEQARAPVLFITDANVEACQNWDIPVFRDLRPKRALCATISDKGSSWIGYGCMLDLPSMGIQWIPKVISKKRFVPISPCTGTVLHSSLFHKLGGYDTAMPIYGAAEPEFSVRLWLYGGEIINCPDLILTHRFRPKEERQPFLEKIKSVQRTNYIRFGLLYLNEWDTTQMLKYWGAQETHQLSYPLSASELFSVRERRNHLQKCLPRNFNWFLNQINNFSLSE